MSFLVILIYWRHSVLTSQWDYKMSECREAVSSANYDQNRISDKKGSYDKNRIPDKMG